MSRRALLMTMLATASLPLARRAGGVEAFVQPTSTPAPIRFEVVRQDAVIGRHEVDFAVDGSALTVRTGIDIEVRMLGVRVFVFEHESTELWRDGRLQAFDSKTLDDDSSFFAAAAATPEGLRVTNRKETFVAPADIMVGSFWTPAMAHQGRLLDPQRGRIKDQRLLGTEAVTLPVKGTARPATRYTLQGVVDGSVSYDARGTWLAATLKKKGSDIFYRLPA